MDSFETFLGSVKPDLQPIVRALHEQLMEIEPKFEHKKAWLGYGYKIGSNYSVNIVEYKAHIMVMIMRGIMLNDPHKYLEGVGVNTRHIKYFTVDDVTKKKLAPYLKQQFSLYKSGIRWEQFMNEAFAEVFKHGGKTNSLGRSSEVLAEVLADKQRMAELYDCISDDDAWVRMRAIDTLEKVFREQPKWADPFVDDMFTNLIHSPQPSVQWHLAQIFSGIELSENRKKQAVEWLSKLLSTVDVDWIVATNAMRTLHEFMDQGLLDKTQLATLLKVQLGHKSKSVVKRANKYLAEIENI